MKIVVSAVSLIDGGTHNIAKTCLEYLSTLSDKYDVLAIVHDRGLFPEIDGIDFIEYPAAKKSWVGRLYYEFYYANKISRELQPYLWLSLHDITTRVVATKRAVYCHNPSPFFRGGYKYLFKDINFFMFTSFYKYLYSFGITKNDFVIVQQKWLKSEFEKLFSVKNVIVCRPDSPVIAKDLELKIPHKPKQSFNIFYPCLPRIFKNVETLCEAISVLPQAVNCKLILTIKGDENKYANQLFTKYSQQKRIVFGGVLNHAQVNSAYSESDLLVFPSLLETWGLPITEAKSYKLPMLLADLPYARETVGNYDDVTFFPPQNHIELSRIINKCINQNHFFHGNAIQIQKSNRFTEGWADLFNVLLEQQEVAR